MGKESIGLGHLIQEARCQVTCHRAYVTVTWRGSVVLSVGHVRGAIAQTQGEAIASVAMTTNPRPAWNVKGLEMIEWWRTSRRVRAAQRSKKRHLFNQRCVYCREKFYSNKERKTCSRSCSFKLRAMNLQTT